MDGNRRSPHDQRPHRGPVEQAVGDLADRLGVPATDITFQSIEEVTWRDGSLGCPRPDMRYIQVLINGYRIRLVHQGKSYSYHGGVGHKPFLCEASADARPSPAPPHRHPPLRPKLD